MTHTQTMSTLKKWLELLTAFSKITVNLTDDQQIVDARIIERQQIIDSLQLIDGELTEIRALRKAGWPGFPPESIKKLEALVEKGNVISSSCVAKDQITLENAANFRKNVSGQISNVRKTKGYLVSSHVVKRLPSIIVDGHA